MSSTLHLQGRSERDRPAAQRKPGDREGMERLARDCTALSSGFHAEPIPSSVQPNLHFGMALISSALCGLHCMGILGTFNHIQKRVAQSCYKDDTEPDQCSHYA